MPIQVRPVFGTINDLNGNPYPNAVVRAGVYSQPLLDPTSGVGIVADYVETLTTSTGYFSMLLPRGFLVYLSIPCLGYRENITVPDDSSSPVNFISLTPS
jgi:hypothetical protein